MSNEQNNYSVDSAPKDPKCPGEGACEHVFFLHQQSRYIDDLRSQLSAIMAERDLLLCEVSRLKFELEIADIKRINDDRTETSTKTDTSSTETHQHFNGNVHSEENTSENYTTENSPSNSYGTHNWAQNVNKKGSFRNTNDTLQRSRVQHVYELSQDLLDKQIEMLERKYGGDKARNAALTIQRAFRHYTLVKKFATITSMAKAEKRFSRRLMAFQEEGSDTRFLDCFASNTNLKQNTNLPLRSLSMREKRSLSSPMPTLPRSYSGRCELACYSAANINQQCSTREPCTEKKTEESNGVSNKSRTPRIPPEVPKRTSSISIRSLENPAGNANLNKNSDSGSISSVQSSGSESSVIHPVTTIKNINVPETVRKRQYRVGLNLFNKKPERGISYLIKHGFLENSPQHIAQFLITRKKGLSKQMIGEYLGNLQDPFNGAVLEFFAQELDLSGMQVDVALRKFQTYFRMPGEAQKVERIIEVFSHRYCQCNRDMVARLRSIDTVFVLAFAIIMLNTDLHTPNIKADRRMTLDDFIKNLRGVDDCCDIDKNMLIGIYKRVKANEFKTAADHVHQVLKVQSTIVGKIPNLALPHRRLVCYCRLYEVRDIYKKEKDGVHQREVFLFNDLLVITKLLSKKKSSVTYTFRQSFSLSGLAVSLFEVPYYPFGIRLSQRVDNQVLVTFNARNDHDRVKFVEDIRESISEMDEMENLRIEAELEKQKTNRNGRSVSGNCNENRDSGVADVEVCPCIHSESPTHYSETHTNLKRSALSNSLLDIHEQAQCPVAQFSEPPQVYSTSLDQSDSL